MIGEVTLTQDELFEHTEDDRWLILRYGRNLEKVAGKIHIKTVIKHKTVAEAIYS